MVMAKDISQPPPQTLSGEINAATRNLHTTLNRLITSRLPLALPPHASDASPYITGLVHFAHIFLTFESLWADLSPASPSDPPHASPLLSFLLVNPYDTSDPNNMFSTPPTPRMLAFLRDLRPPGLARSARLKADLAALTGLHETDLSVLLATYPGDQVAAYCAHIRSTVGKKPHVLVAYAWCYYMAVFSGGRWIRGELLKAPKAFWKAAAIQVGGVNETAELSDRGLSLWHFDGDMDGEPVKAEFKLRLAEAEDLFTNEERVDVIEEAKQIFIRSAQLVDELDELLGTDMKALKHGEARPLQHTKDKAEEESGVVLGKDAVLWLKRPEVTGAVVALGCVACVALLKLAT